MASGEQRTNYSADEIKAEVRDTIRQLSEMTRTEHDFDQFCQVVLNKVVQLTGAHGALLWQVNGNNQPSVTHRAASKSAEQIAPNAQTHSRVVLEVIGNEQALGITSESLDEANTENESVPYLMLFSPVFNRNKQCCGSLELLQRNEITKSAQEGYLRFLSQIAQLFPRWHEQQDLARLTQSETKWSNKLEYINEVHNSLDLKETAYSIANEARRLLGCDRVSVGRWDGRRCKVIAISSQDRFDNRANVVRKLGNVATSSVSADTTFWVIGDTEGLAPEVADQINDYLDESHCRTLAVIPLADRPPEQPDLEMNKRAKLKTRKLGALILEYFDTDVPETQILETKKLIVTQAEQAFDNARQHSEVFLLPLWQKLGSVQKWLFANHFAKTMTVLAALLILTLAMIFYQAQMKMRVDGVLHPTIRRNIFTKADQGTISQVYVEDHAQVKVGDPLLEITDPELEMQISEVELQMATISEDIAAARRMRTFVDPENETERLKLAAQINSYNIQLTSLTERKKLLDEKRDFLQIYSPIDGEVITWDANRRLKDLPVKFNQFVMSIEQTEGPWELELKIPQMKVGYVMAAMAEAERRGEQLDVEFILGLDANSKFTGKLIRVAERAEMSDAGIPEFRAVVSADTSDIDPEDLRPGAGVTAKIVCGRASLGKVWTHQVLDWLKTNVFF